MNRFALTAVASLLFLLAGVPSRAADETAKAEPKVICSYDIHECLNWMAKHYGERGWAGMNLDVDGYTYKVTAVRVGSPAEKAGIEVGDLLVAINGVEIAEENSEKLLPIRESMKPGAEFTYTVKRNGKRRNVECVLVAMPVEVVAEQIGMHLLTGHLEPDLAFPEKN